MKNKKYGYKHGGPAGHDGNKHARREEKRIKKGTGGRINYGHGGVSMEGSQPKYKGTPKCMPN